MRWMLWSLLPGAVLLAAGLVRVCGRNRCPNCRSWDTHLIQDGWFCHDCGRVW